MQYDQYEQYAPLAIPLRHTGVSGGNTPLHHSVLRDPYHPYHPYYPYYPYHPCHQTHHHPYHNLDLHLAQHTTAQAQVLFRTA